MNLSCTAGVRGCVMPLVLVQDEAHPLSIEELSRTMELQQASFELAEGKLSLLRGRFDEARTFLERAHSVLGGWKLRTAVLLVLVAPRLLRRLAERRQGGDIGNRNKTGGRRAP